MSILNDYRRYSNNDEEREEWECEVKREYVREEYEDMCREDMYVLNNDDLWN